MKAAQKHKIMDVLCGKKSGVLSLTEVTNSEAQMVNWIEPRIVCVCVCVCVYEREREREREYDKLV